MERRVKTARLSAVETAALEGLQVGLDQRLEPMDDQLLAGLDRMKLAVKTLPDDTTG